MKEKLKILICDDHAILLERRIKGMLTTHAIYWKRNSEQ